MLSERLRDEDLASRTQALRMISQEVKGATASMTSVPKPLKFLCGQYKSLKEYFD